MKKNLSILFSIIILSAFIGLGVRLVFALLVWEEPTDTPPFDNEIPLWIKNGNDLYHTTGGNVGIGSTSPQEKMDIGGVLRAVSGNSSPGKGPGYGAIQGWSNLVGAGGFGYGTGAVGVYGNATNYGILGIGTTGVYGYTASPIGFGGYFTNNPSTGQGNGLYASSICLGSTSDCKTAWSQVSGASDWSAITNKPAGFADNTDNVGITSETDPTVYQFAKVVLPTCTSAQKLTGNGTSLSCATDEVGGGSSISWASITNKPAGFTDDVDNDTTYSAGTGLSLSGTTFSVNMATAQQRVTGTCAAGNSIRVINQDGTVTCEADDTGAGGGVTSINSQTGPAITIKGGGSATVTSSGNTITISTPTCSPATAAITCSSNNTQSCSASCPSGYIITSWTCDAGNKTISGNTGSCWWNTNVYRSGSGSCTKSC